MTEPNLRQPGDPQPPRASSRARATSPAADLAARILQAVALVENRGGNGSGFLAGAPRLLVTAWHVAASEPRLRIHFDGHPALLGRPLIGRRDADLALVRLPDLGAPPPGGSSGPDGAAAGPGPGLPLGDASELRPGLEIHLAGHPCELAWFASRGTVGRVDAEPGGLTRIFLDAVSGPGGSGSPVVDDTGRVVGVAVGRHGQLPTVQVAASVEHLAELFARAAPLLDRLGSCHRCRACGHLEPAERPACSRCGGSRMLGELDRFACPLCDEPTPLLEGFCPACGVDLAKAFSRGWSRPGREASPPALLPASLAGPTLPPGAARRARRHPFRWIRGQRAAPDFEALCAELRALLRSWRLDPDEFTAPSGRHTLVAEYGVDQIGVLATLRRLPGGSVWLSTHATVAGLPEADPLPIYRRLLAANLEELEDEALGVRDGEVVLRSSHRLDGRPPGTLARALHRSHRLAARWARELEAATPAGEGGRPAPADPAGRDEPAATRPDSSTPSRPGAEPGDRDTLRG